MAVAGACCQAQKGVSLTWCSVVGTSVGRVESAAFLVPISLDDENCCLHHSMRRPAIVEEHWNVEDEEVKVWLGTSTVVLATTLAQTRRPPTKLASLCICRFCYVSNEVS